MEIRSLRLIVTEADLSDFLGRACSWPETVRDVRIALAPEGVVVSGTYYKIIGIPFHMLWVVSVSKGKITAQVGRLKAGFLSLSFLKRYFLQAIAGVSSLVELRDETLVFDVEALLRDSGLPLRTNLSAIRCDYGSLTVECGEVTGGEAAD